MNGGLSHWHRVSRRQPCPVCAKPDWCLFAGDPANPDVAICARIESSRRIGEAGYLHRLRMNATYRRSFCTRSFHLTSGNGRIVNLAHMAEQFSKAVGPGLLQNLAQRMGLSVESLKRLRIGWSAQMRAWSFPMVVAITKNNGFPVVGIRLRLSDGRKIAVRGSRNGLFLPDRLNGVHPDKNQLLICEGPSDTAALLDLGFNAVGRPSCNGGGRLLVEFIKALVPKYVVIVADRDVPGEQGAASLASRLVPYALSVRVIRPPIGLKDGRAWIQGGATSQDVQAAIDEAIVQRLSICVGCYGR